MTEVVSTIASVRAATDAARLGGGRVGLVPTMGYLHAGHRSLMRAARSDCDLVVVSVFVNPMQFGPSEDLDRYPRDLDGDIAACADEHVDLVFAPSVREVYPEYPPATVVHVDGLTEGLCGASRPGHFDGVTTVVAKLFAIIGPCRAYFGEKDAQQLAVVRRMGLDLNLPVDVVGCPIVREPDGLALSSRNAYLTTEERAAAPGIARSLRAATAAVDGGEREAAVLTAGVRAVLGAIDGLDIDYVECVDADTIAPIERLRGEVLLAVAVRLGQTRLIDNVRFRLAP